MRVYGWIIIHLGNDGKVRENELNGRTVEDSMSELHTSHSEMDALRHTTNRPNCFPKSLCNGGLVFRRLTGPITKVNTQFRRKLDGCRLFELWINASFPHLCVHCPATVCTTL